MAYGRDDVVNCLAGWLRRSQLRRRKAMRGCYSHDGGDFWSTMWPGGPALQHGMPLATLSWPTLSGDSFAAIPTCRCTHPLRAGCEMGTGYAAVVASIHGLAARMFQVGSILASVGGPVT